jgi:EAL domain-containing protein (putative c-di-GMP-specific phosphodiesterase class I)
VKAPSSANQDAAIAEFLERLGRRKRDKNYAVHLRLSESYFYRRNRAFLSIASNTVMALAQRYLGQMFTLANEDLFFVFIADDDAELVKVAKQLQYLFAEDPMAFESGSGTDYEKLCTWYNLVKEFGEFRAAIEAVIDTGAKDRDAEKATGRRKKRDETLEPLTTGEVAGIENALRQADVSIFLKRQPVAVVLSDQKPETVFNEFYLSINAIKQRLFPKIDLRNSRWLFQALTALLDDRMLAHLKRDRGHARFSINLNVPTVLSEKFVAFDESVKSGARGSIVVEFQRADALYDFGAFRMARDYLRSRGYRVCLDGVTPDVLGIFSHADLDVDFMKLFYFKDQEADWQSAKVRDLVKASNKLRLIMARVDEEAALRLGKTLGINLFQGFFVDRLIAAYESRHPSTSALKRALVPPPLPIPQRAQPTVPRAPSVKLGKAER